jgi:hypothetical protein
MMTMRTNKLPYIKKSAALFAAVLFLLLSACRAEPPIEPPVLSPADHLHTAGEAIGFSGIMDYIIDNWSISDVYDYIKDGIAIPEQPPQTAETPEPEPEPDPVPDPVEEPPYIPVITETPETEPIHITPYEQLPAAAPPSSATQRPPSPPGTVYWVASGQVYHATPGCSSLSRSRNIISGTVAQSGKDRGCRICTE